jgi:NAD(P)-dependent dehydrogenase (short-subunit alcohol dehydrogenase family)
MRKLSELLDLKGRTVFITGGSGYLGTAMCETLAEMGADIAIAEVNAATCEALTGRLKADYGVRAIGLACDVRKPESIREALRATVQQLGGLHILINNAYAGNKNRFETITYEEWQANLEIGLSSVFYGVREAFEYLKQTRGVILNTASMYGHVSPDYRLYEGNPHAVPASYNAAKGGVLQLTRYLASFLSPHGIRVNAISPGAFPHEWQMQDTEFGRRLAAKAPLNRVGMPEDIKGAVALLCSDAGQFMTGQNICVDGGWTIW